MSEPLAPLVHLVRHGEVHNPHHVVYASLSGFDLNERGEAEAEAAALHLAGRPVVAVISSPLVRARHTARIIALAHGLEASVDDALTEWRLSERWAGTPWDDLPRRFPGELEAYLESPERLPFSPESLDALASRMAGAIARHAEAATGEIVVVSHQDPIQAARLRLLDRPLEALSSDKPGHASVLALRPGRPWIEVGRWDPPHQ